MGGGGSPITPDLLIISCIISISNFCQNQHVLPPTPKMLATFGAGARSPVFLLLKTFGPALATATAKKCGKMTLPVPVAALNTARQRRFATSMSSANLPNQCIRTMPSVHKVMS